MKRLLLQVALMILVALGWAGSAHSTVLLDNVSTAYVGGHMTHFVLLGILAVLILVHFMSRRRVRA